MRKPCSALLLAWLPIVSCVGCSSTGSDDGAGEVVPPPPPPINVVVVADLSDRIATPEQVVRDTAIIRIVGEVFKEHCRQVGYLFSRDRLRFQGVRTTLLDNDIAIDVGYLNAKNERVVERIDPELTRFRRDCALSYAPQGSYAGADLWGYFKNDLGAVLEREDVLNRVIVLTDGYINFNGEIQAHRPVNTQMRIGELRGKRDWERVFESYALAGVGRRFANTELLVLEIAPKGAVQSVHEYDILKRYWTAWADSMGIAMGPDDRNIYTNSLQLSAIRQKVTEFLRNGPSLDGVPR